ncbi:MAG: hypothetical protein ACI9J2_001136 [Saprospiraceae bacterium]|jgi:hypothetical protein
MFQNKTSFFLYCLVIGTLSFSANAEEEKLIFKRTPVHYIAALGNPMSSEGIGAETWGIWRKDPGLLNTNNEDLVEDWDFDKSDWWIGENGAVMEPPSFPLPAGMYLVTGTRETTAMLTIHPIDGQGEQRWELDDDATLYDVTHLPCLSARYQPETTSVLCLPSSLPEAAFPMSSGGELPDVENCDKQDYSVLFVIAIRV